MLISQSELVAVLDDSPAGVVILDAQGQVVYRNKCFCELAFHMAEQVIACHQDMQIDEYQVSCKYQLDYRILYVSPLSKSADQINPNDSLLRIMLEKVESRSDIFDAIAEAIFEITGWRWIFITRFINAKSVETISFWDTDHHALGASYELVDTPCEELVKRKRFTLFADVSKTFPKNPFLADLGAKSYAGLIYYGEGRKPLGHIMCMHDSNDVDYKFMEDVVKLASLVISSNLLLAQVQSELKEAIDQASIDSLTQLNNRRMFEESCLQVVSDYQKTDLDSSICIIDINDFKLFNDSFGHPKGDLLLRLFANELSKIGSEHDQVFRLGGDEFALITAKVSDQAINRLKEQFEAAQQRLSAVIDHPVTACMGVASLSETGANLEQCYELADIRMYKDKARAKAKL
jgi:diguanylate cyclase (GGDEF)-like protein